MKDEKTRETLFKEAQISREERFSRVMEDYMATARKDEAEREILFAGWELSVQTQFSKMLNGWKQEFTAVEVERRRRESVFIQSGGEQYLRETGPLSKGAGSSVTYDREELVEMDDWMDDLNV